MASHSCWLFNHVPGAHPSWTLAVMAVSVTDARQAIKAAYGGGKLVKEIRDGKVQADCGLTTEAASEAIRNAREKALLEMSA